MYHSAAGRAWPEARLSLCDVAKPVKFGTLVIELKYCSHGDHGHGHGASVACPASPSLAESTSPKCAPSATAVIASAGYNLFLSTLPLASNAQGCFLSPLSIVYALSLAINGAGPGCPTQLELLRVIAGPANGNEQPQHQPLTEAEVNSELGRAMALMCSQEDGGGSAPGGGSGSGGGGGGGGPRGPMVLANSVWTGQGVELKADYVNRMRSLFQATARAAVNGAKDVNDWVSDVTRGMITSLVQSDNFSAVLANAIYFKGPWEKAFKEELTRPGPFTTASGANKMVDMMERDFKAQDHIRGARKYGVYDAVVLPYRGGAFSAVALLPAPGVQVAEALRDWAEGPQDLAPMGGVLVKLPKFKVTSSLSLTPALQSLGVQAAFSPGAADFSRMAAPGLFVSDVFHKAVVEVDEEGTVAAAATAVIMCLSLPPPPAELVFEHIIEHNATGLPVFVGVVNDPTAA